MPSNPSNPDAARPKLPNVYSAMADMGAYSPAAKPGAPGAAAAQPSAEKVQSVVTLLEVVRKMERMETDPAAKDLLQQMVQIAQQYMDKVNPGAGKAAGTGTAPDSTAQAADNTPAPPATGEGATVPAAAGM